MANSNCGCGGTTPETNQQTVVVQQAPEANCPVTVSNQVCLQADLEVIPSIETETINVTCVGSPFIGRCNGSQEPQPCRFSVSQVVCAEFMINFSAIAMVENTSAVCEEPVIGPCPEPGACTHTIGYWRNQGTQFVEDNLPILLGNGGGLSINVDTLAEALLILQPATGPSPVPQYNQLYAQLLAAKLNVLNGATCQGAVDAIAAGDAFLSGSAVADQPLVAAALAMTLEMFNSGSLTGCPPECV
ncbi:hypothetical protein [Paenibacillus chungangensis]|uniref:Uncharacterized protein n=1 Tax=Paenibacillus chungangensis TaxID=696535 RepID=A0ABW3HQE0_9BACL